jgi:hypothetical protein
VSIFSSSVSNSTLHWLCPPHIHPILKAEPKNGIGMLDHIFGLGSIMAISYTIKFNYILLIPAYVHHYFINFYNLAKFQKYQKKVGM